MYNVNQINQAWDSINDLIPDLRKGKIKKKADTHLYKKWKCVCRTSLDNGILTERFSIYSYFSLQVLFSIFTLYPMNPLEISKYISLNI